MPETPTQEKEIGFVPTSSIVTVRTANPEEGSYYNPFNEAIGGAELVFANDAQTMEGAAVNDLFDYSCRIKEVTKAKIESLLDMFQAETDADQDYIIEKTSGDNSDYLFHFSDKFFLWLKHKQEGESDADFLYTHGFTTADDQRFITYFRNFADAKSKVVAAHWEGVGPFTEKEMKELAIKARSTAAKLLSAPDARKKILDNTKAHEREHYFQNKVMWNGAFGDIFVNHLIKIEEITSKLINKRLEQKSDEAKLNGSYVPLVELFDQAKNDFVESKVLREALLSTRLVWEQLKGLCEADSIFVEALSTGLTMDKESRLDSDVLTLRAATLLSAFKRYAVGKPSDLEAQISSMFDKPLGGSVQEHNLGTILLLTNGSILSQSDQSIFDFTALGKNADEARDSLLRLLAGCFDGNSETSVEALTKKIDLRELQARIREKMRVCLIKLVEVIDLVYTSAQELILTNPLLTELPSTSYQGELATIRQKLSGEFDQDLKKKLAA